MNRTKSPEEVEEDSRTEDIIKTILSLEKDRDEIYEVANSLAAALRQEKTRGESLESTITVESDKAKDAQNRFDLVIKEMQDAGYSTVPGILKDLKARDAEIIRLKDERTKLNDKRTAQNAELNQEINTLTGKLDTLTKEYTSILIPLGIDVPISGEELPFQDVRKRLEEVVGDSRKYREGRENLWQDFWKKWRKKLRKKVAIYGTGIAAAGFALAIPFTSPAQKYFSQFEERRNAWQNSGAAVFLVSNSSFEYLSQTKLKLNQKWGAQLDAIDRQLDTIEDYQGEIEARMIDEEKSLASKNDENDELRCIFHDQQGAVCLWYGDFESPAELLVKYASPLSLSPLPAEELLSLQPAESSPMRITVNVSPEQKSFQIKDFTCSPYFTKETKDQVCHLTGESLTEETKGEISCTLQVERKNVERKTTKGKPNEPPKIIPFSPTLYSTPLKTADLTAITSVPQPLPRLFQKYFSVSDLCPSSGSCENMYVEVACSDGSGQKETKIIESISLLPAFSVQPTNTAPTCNPGDEVQRTFKAWWEGKMVREEYGCTIAGGNIDDSELKLDSGQYTLKATCPEKDRIVHVVCNYQRENNEVSLDIYVRNSNGEVKTEVLANNAQFELDAPQINCKSGEQYTGEFSILDKKTLAPDTQFDCFSVVNQSELAITAGYSLQGICPAEEKTYHIQCKNSDLKGTVKVTPTSPTPADQKGTPTNGVSDTANDDAAGK